MNSYSVERVADFLKVLYDLGNRPGPKQTAAVIRLSFNTRDGIGLADKSLVTLEAVWYWDGTNHWDGTKHWSGEPI